MANVSKLARAGLWKLTKSKQQMKKCLFRKNLLNMDELRQCLYPLSQDLFLSFTAQHDKSLLWVNADKNKGLILYPGVYSWAT